MPGTLVTLKQIFLEPEQVAQVINEKNKTHYESLSASERPAEPPVKVRSTVHIPHTEAGRCQCIGAEFIAGGNQAAGRWRLDIVVFEPSDG